MSEKTTTTYAHVAEAAPAASAPATQCRYALLQGEWAPNRWAYHVWNHYFDIHDDECQPEFPRDISAIKQHATDIICEELQGCSDDKLLPNVDLLASLVAELIHDHIHKRD